MMVIGLAARFVRVAPSRDRDAQSVPPSRRAAARLHRRMGLLPLGRSDDRSVRFRCGGLEPFEPQKRN
jgi:hypothetical protein